MRGQIGPYRVLGSLGEGAMGVTYRALCPVRGHEVALKLVRAGIAGPEEYRRLQREARVLGALQHPNLVAVYDLGEHHGAPYVVMELVQGGDLAERLRREGRLPPREAADLVRKIAAGVAPLHANGIVHRDLKPANVLLDLAGEPRVCDLGLAGGNELSRLTQTGAVLGTPLYMAPEQVIGEALTPAVDVYALGVVLFELLVGEPPFAGALVTIMNAHMHDPPPRVAELCPLAPPALVALVERCLEKDPSDRFADASELSAALGEAVLGEGPASSRTVGLAGVVALGLAGVALAGLALVWRGAAPQPTKPLPAGEGAPRDLESECAALCERGEALLLGDSFVKAREAFELARELRPASARAVSGLARVAALEGRRLAAIDLFAAALELDPRNLYAVLGHAYLTLPNDRQATRSVLRQAVKLWPDSPDPLVTQAQVLHELGQVGEAMELTRKALRRFPENAETHFLHGQFLSLAQRRKEAFDAVGTACRLAPLNARFAYSEIELHRQLKDLPPAEVLDRVRAAVARFPSSARLRCMRIMLEHEAGESTREAAIDALGAVASANPLDLEPRIVRAELLHRYALDLGLEQADIAHALEANPSSVRALMIKRKHSLSVNDRYGAWAAARTLAELMPSAKEYQRERIQLARRANQLEDLNLAIDEVWRRWPGESSAGFLVAQLVFSGQFSRAQELVNAARASQPSSPVLRGLAECLDCLTTQKTVLDPRVLQLAKISSVVTYTQLSLALRSKNLPAARELLPQVEAAHGADPAFMVLRGEAERILGRPLQALQLFENALELQPNNSIALLGLGVVNAEFGAKSEAVSLVNLAVLLAEEQGLDLGPTPPSLLDAMKAAGAPRALSARDLQGGVAELEGRALAAWWRWENGQAHVLARAVLARQPDRVAAWILLARVHARREQFLWALQALRRVDPLEWNNPEALTLQIRLVLLVGQLSRLTDVELLLTRLEAQDSEGFYARMARVFLTHAREDSARTRGVVQALVRDFPEEAGAWSAWASIMSALDPELASSTLQSMLDRDPDRPLWAQLGQLYEQLGQAEQARACFREAITRGDSRVHAAIGWARLSMAAGDLRPALLELERTLDVHGLQPRLWYQLGLCHEGLGNLQAACESFARCASLSVGELKYTALVELSRSSLASGAIATAGVHAQQLVEFDPRRAAGHVLLGEVALRQGRLEDAVEHALAVKGSGDVTEAEAKWADEVIAGER